MSIPTGPSLDLQEATEVRWWHSVGLVAELQAKYNALGAGPRRGLSASEPGLPFLLFFLCSDDGFYMRLLMLLLSAHAVWSSARDENLFLYNCGGERKKKRNGWADEHWTLRLGSGFSPSSSCRGWTRLTKGRSFDDDEAKLLDSLDGRIEWRRRFVC